MATKETHRDRPKDEIVNLSNFPVLVWKEAATEISVRWSFCYGQTPPAPASHRSMGSRNVVASKTLNQSNTGRVTAEAHCHKNLSSVPLSHCLKRLQRISKMKSKQTTTATKQNLVRKEENPMRRKQENPSVGQAFNYLFLSSLVPRHSGTVFQVRNLWCEPSV